MWIYFHIVLRWERQWVEYVIEFPGIHIEAIQPPVPASVAHIDYSEEAVEYEKKLVQVTAAYLCTNTPGVCWHVHMLTYILKIAWTMLS